MRAPRWLRRRRHATVLTFGRRPITAADIDRIVPNPFHADAVPLWQLRGVPRLREDLGVCDAPGHWRFPHERLGRPFPCQHWSAIPVQPRPLPLLAGRLWNDPPLAWVEGPWPTERVDRPIPITPAERSWLINFQGDAHITVDGELGPQTWVELAHYNTRERRAS